MSTGIISYGAGNGRSVLYALERLGMTAFISDDPDRLAAADRVIFPGVGAAGHAMQNLQERGLDRFILDYRKPFLGICLGMQLLCRYSEEGQVPCLGIFSEGVQRFMGDMKVPHTGWNSIQSLGSSLFSGIDENAFTYYVHSYFVAPCAATIAITTYKQPFSAALQRDNYYGLQFHPEKSGAAGERILSNFLKL